MDRYICGHCGRGFGWPEVLTDRETGERHLASPCCRSSFQEAARCGSCGKLIAADSGPLCPACRKSAVERFRLLLGRFTPEEREAINDAYDGVPLTEPRGAA